METPVVNVKSTRRSTDKGCWRLRYITDLGKVEIRVLADYSNSEEPQGQSSRGRVSEETCGFINSVLCM